MLKVFIGYDSRETVAYHVCAHSILSRANAPVSVIPLALHMLPMFRRERDILQSTEFAFTRFLVPYLSGFEGVSIFMDCDMLVRCDINEILDNINLANDVSCVKHDYTPKTETKFLGQVQSAYPRKNWSSVMVFNNAKCRILTPELVNNASGAFLHRFQWAENVGELGSEWNHLVGEYDPNPKAKIVHFTLGTPCFPGYEDQEYADLWRDEYRMMNSSSR